MGRAASEQYIWNYILLRGKKKGNAKESLKILVNLPCEILQRNALMLYFCQRLQITGVNLITKLSFKF